MHHNVIVGNGNALYIPGATGEYRWVTLAGKVPLQYTGLKDKNGVEIYEGDILKFPTLYETPEMCSTQYTHEQVLFADGAFYLKEKSGKYMHENTLACEMNAYDWNFEVIGNIHEHPHLLEKEVNND